VADIAREECPDRKRRRKPAVDGYGDDGVWRVTPAR
jgi:hypothetical protein